MVSMLFHVFVIVVINVRASDLCGVRTTDTSTFFAGGCAIKPMFLTMHLYCSRLYIRTESSLATRLGLLLGLCKLEQAFLFPASIPIPQLRLLWETNILVHVQTWSITRKLCCAVAHDVGGRYFDCTYESPEPFFSSNSLLRRSFKVWSPLSAEAP